MKKNTFLRKTQGSLVYLLFLVYGSLYPQAGAIDLSFGHPVTQVGDSLRCNNSVNAVLVQPNQKVLVAGSFTSYNGIARPRIMRLNADGNYDATFTVSTGFSNGTVNTLALQSDGKILAGGNFTTYNSQPRRGVVRINADGTLDDSFTVGDGFSGEISAIALQPDGKIVVGGTFTTYNGATANRIARLNTDGSLDANFVTGTGFNTAVNSIAYDASSNSILVGGNFNNYNGTARNRLVRLTANGGLDTGFVIGTGFNAAIEKIALQANGQLIVVGNFTSYNGTSGKNRIIRLNADGTPDNLFVTGTGFNVVAYEVKIDGNGKILVGGNFTTYNGIAKSRLIRLLNDGSVDDSFLSAGANNDVYAIGFHSNGKIICGGDFTDYNNTYRYRIMRLKSDGSLDNVFHVVFGFTYNIYPSSKVNATAIQPDGKILVGGEFQRYNGEINHYLIRLDQNGNRDYSFVSGFDTWSGTGNYIKTIKYDTATDKIYIGGNFNYYGGAARNDLARINLDGSLDTTFNIGNGFTGSVHTIQIQNDGKVVVGGEFGTYDGAASANIVRLDSNGTRDLSFNVGSGFLGHVNRIAIQPDGKIVAGGIFASYNGTSSNRLARLNVDGSYDATFAIGSVLNSIVDDIVVQPDNKILVGGSFNPTGMGRGIIRFNPDGSVDNSFLVGTGVSNIVRTIALQSNGQILLGGLFSSYNGIVNNRIVRLNANGTYDASFVSEMGFDDEVFTISVANDQSILVGGSFVQYNGYFVNSLARINASELATEDFSEGSDTAAFAYPNPAIDKLQIRSAQPVLAVAVYDANGRECRVSFDQAGQVVDVAALQSGFYVLSAATASGVQSIKLIKK